MAKAEKDKNKKPSTDTISQKEEITLKETEDDIFGKAFKSDPDDFKNEIVKEAQKTGAFSFLLPLFVFLLIAGLSATATYYYAKPERSIEATEIKAEDKIQNLPDVDEPAVTETPETPVQNTPAPKDTPTASQDIVYTVKEGDTMSGIANKYDMTSSELAKYNGLSDVNSLKIGQTLKIPSK